jgi:hypothetical protein
VAVTTYRHGSDCFGTVKGSGILSVSSVKTLVVTVLGEVAGILHTYLLLNVAISSLMDASDQALLILPIMQDPKSLSLHGRLFLR